ncbi:MAG: hypothetical protein JOY54_20465 [Acidobacteriaceae bacterium]|nr:hypothetical protein [Acidobacteriaceae bacterium]
MLFLIPMTKVQTKVKLSRPLVEEDLGNIARVHAVFGFLAVRVSASGDELFVEYDYSRLSLNDVRGSLQEHGIPIV